MDDRAEPAFLTPEQLAARWQVQPELLANWRYRGVGPVHTKLGHAVRYAMSDVEVYEAQQRGNTA